MPIRLHKIGSYTLSKIKILTKDRTLKSAEELYFGSYYHPEVDLESVYSGDIYVLTNTRSFSAAMDFTMDIMDNDLGTVVGEACGNLPDSYGDVLSFQTPNSGLRFSISYKRWFRTDESKTGQPLEPDYPCPSNEAMDKAYELILEGE